MKKIITFILLLLLSFSLLSIAIDDYLSEKEKSEFARHRSEYYKSLGDNVAVFVGSTGRFDTQRWKQDANFFYLTGCQVPGAALIMDGTRNKTILFLPPVSDSARQWMGITIGPGAEAKKAYGISDTRSIEDFSSVLTSVLSSKSSVYYLHWPAEEIAVSPSSYFGVVNEIRANPWHSGYVPKEDSVLNWLKSANPGITVVNSYVIIRDLRKIKSDWELEQIQMATDLAANGHVAAMQATKPGAWEYELEAAATNEFLKGGAMFIGYGAIVASGTNSGYLHYDKSSRQMKRGELVIMDYGPAYNYYVADITRTWPVKGKFTKKQAKIYNDLLEIHNLLIDSIKPGVSFTDLNELCWQKAEDLGYEDIFTFTVGHHTGLSVHDPISGSLPFVEGSVVALEPGLYFDKYNKTNMRVEDMILVTKKGAEVLSKEIPITIEEIEAVMNKK